MFSFVHVYVHVFVFKSTSSSCYVFYVQRIHEITLDCLHVTTVCLLVQFRCAMGV